jgi:undecaprenyl diphosphate synthase
MREQQIMTQRIGGEVEADWLHDYGIRHLAIIPDGNRRWARERSMPIALGHSKGLLQVLPHLVHCLSDAGVHTMTVWGFSTENWNRASAEVEHLMDICAEFLETRLLSIAERHSARVCHMGRKDRLPLRVRTALAHVEESTRENERHVYNLALDYGGHDELVRAGERMLLAAERGVPRGDLRIANFLDTSGQPHPEPDLVVRSSGEMRMSGFMPLQAAYSEWFFSKVLFPDFTFDTLKDVAESFRERKRRFGA